MVSSPLAEQLLGPLEAAALREVPLVRDQHVTDVLRVIDEEHLLAAHRKWTMSP